MTDPETECIIAVLCKNGGYYINHESNVMVIVTDFDDVTSKDLNQIYVACARAKVNLVMYPPKVTDFPASPLHPLIDWFMRLNLNPSFLFTIKILPPLFISDDAIYLGKNSILDKENLINDIISEERDWLYVKNDEQSEDVLTSMINEHVKRERGFMSTTMVIGKQGIKNMGSLFATLDKMKKK